MIRTLTPTVSENYTTSGDVTAFSQDRPRDAATVLFNLPGCRALDARTTSWGGGRWSSQSTLRGTAQIAGSTRARVHSRPVSRVADVPIAGRLEVRVRKRRLWCDNSVTNARTEAANLNAKNIKRAGRGYVNHDNYRARILLAATVKNAASTPRPRSKSAALPCGVRTS